MTKLSATQEKVRALQRYKRTRGCSDCGNRELPGICYDFHHRDPAAKEFTISQMNRMPWERIMEEVAKCDVLCANCHRQREHEDL